MLSVLTGGPTMAGTAIDLMRPEGLVVVVAGTVPLLTLAFLLFRPRFSRPAD
jgi:hypothetical protein